MPETELSIEGEEKMAADLSDARAELIYDESAQSHSALQHDTRGNEQSAHNVLRHSGVKKYNEVDPIEAAATEMILGKAQKIANS